MTESQHSIRNIKGRGGVGGLSLWNAATINHF